MRLARLERVAPLDVEAVVSNMEMEKDVVVEGHFFGVSAAESKADLGSGQVLEYSQSLVALLKSYLVVSGPSGSLVLPVSLVWAEHLHTFLIVLV